MCTISHTASAPSPPVCTRSSAGRPVRKRRRRSGGKARQALANLQTCLAAAGASIEHVVKWTILIREGESLQDGFAAFGEVWGRRPNPPAITVAQVAGFAVPGAVCELEAIAAVPA
ncbi:RidA family protein [Nocardia amamiensis]|uniref:RidA family protein n=1 Tax=Nocardia amamiensis TaxID=404578 RepID=A0ABS0CZ55_9NOCA|nr:RidA family protein [Nocardia amamiensis]